MTDHLTIVARIVATPGTEDRLEAAMKVLVAETRQEAGCIQYDLHRTTENSCIFVFYENWETKPLWEAHMNGDAIKRFNEKIPGMIESGEVLQMRKVA